MNEEQLKAFREKVKETQINLLLAPNTSNDQLPMFLLQPCDRSIVAKVKILKARFADTPGHTLDIPAGVKQL